MDRPPSRAGTTVRKQPTTLSASAIVPRRRPRAMPKTTSRARGPASASANAPDTNVLIETPNRVAVLRRASESAAVRRSSQSPQPSSPVAAWSGASGVGSSTPLNARFQNVSSAADPSRASSQATNSRNCGTPGSSV
jgi:hypothetical protein